MNETILGKISEVFFGIRDGRFGLWLTLSGEWSVQTNYSCWDPEVVKISKHTKWSEDDRNIEISKIIRKISELLNDTKKENINDLLNTPVEFTAKDGMLDTWGVLKEVL